jgi:hypothetical protein
MKANEKIKLWRRKAPEKLAKAGYQRPAYNGRKYRRGRKLQRSYINEISYCGGSNIYLIWLSKLGSIINGVSSASRRNESVIS